MRCPKCFSRDGRRRTWEVSETFCRCDHADNASPIPLLALRKAVLAPMAQHVALSGGARVSKGGGGAMRLPNGRELTGTNRDVADSC